jgi:uncharacterized protein
MSRFLLIGIASLIVLASGASAQEYPPTLRQLTVTGTGMASEEPDLATITFGIDAKSYDASDAVDQAAGIIDAALRAASRLGVAEEDMRTSSYSLWIENMYDPVTYEYTGEIMYHVTHYISADIRDLDDVGEVLAAVVDAGANSITGVTFTVEDRTGLYDTARVRATQDAARRAAQLAATAGVTLGVPTYISEYSYDYYGDYYGYAEADYSTYGGGAAPSIAPGVFSVSTQVTITYQLD